MKVFVLSFYYNNLDYEGNYFICGSFASREEAEIAKQKLGESRQFAEKIGFDFDNQNYFFWLELGFRITECPLGDLIVLS